jgi:hypothetical protein
MKESWAKRLFEKIADAFADVKFWFKDKFMDIQMWFEDNWLKLLLGLALLGGGGYHLYDKYIKEEPYSLPSDYFENWDNAQNQSSQQTTWFEKKEQEP